MRKTKQDVDARSRHRCGWLPVPDCGGCVTSGHPAAKQLARAVTASSFDRRGAREGDPWWHECCVSPTKPQEREGEWGSVLLYARVSYPCTRSMRCRVFCGPGTAFWNHDTVRCVRVGCGGVYDPSGGDNTTTMRRLTLRRLGWCPVRTRRRDERGGEGLTKRRDHSESLHHRHGDGGAPCMNSPAQLCDVLRRCMLGIGRVAGCIRCRGTGRVVGCAQHRVSFLGGDSSNARHWGANRIVQLHGLARGNTPGPRQAL